MKPSLWIAVAALFMLAYVLVTPPFQVPDEVGHFWRAYSLARGAFEPVREHGKTLAEVPRGVRDLVAVTWVQTAGHPEAKVGVQRLRDAWRVPLGEREPVRIAVPAQYTPVPYAPQIIACFIGDRLHARPLITFYLARLFNAAAALALFAAAAYITKQRWAFIAVALMPMLLFLCASFSADAMTCGLAFVVTAMAIDGDDRRWPRFLVCSFLLALCKGYFLLPFLRAFRLTRARLLILTIVVVTAAAIALVHAKHNYTVVRTDVPTGATAQLVNVRLAPFAFLGIVARDYRDHGYAYLDHFVGRLGWLDVGLPRVLVNITLVLLLAIGLTSERLRMRERMLALAVVLATMLFVSLSQYLGWSPIGADYIEGIQGRYFLPLGPLAVLLFSAGFRYERAVRIAFVAMAVVINIVAIAAIVARYY